VRRLISWIAAIALLTQPGAALAQSGEPAPAPQGVEPQTSLPDIEDEVMCPICGVPLEHATEAPQAQQERQFIRELIAQGLTKDEIKDSLVAEFGDQVLAVPDAEGFDLAAWLVPGAAIIVAAVAIFVGLRRWRSAGDDRAAESPDDERAPSDEDAKRLEEDLTRYDL
jgi:cytochrome c-type biogenesis protein CcmH/NrfF